MRSGSPCQSFIYYLMTHLDYQQYNYYLTYAEPRLLTLSWCCNVSMLVSARLIRWVRLANGCEKMAAKNVHFYLYFSLYLFLSKADNTQLLNKTWTVLCQTLDRLGHHRIKFFPKLQLVPFFFPLIIVPEANPEKTPSYKTCHRQAGVRPHKLGVFGRWR